MDLAPEGDGETARGADGCPETCHCRGLRTARNDAWAEIKALRRTVANQGRLLSLLHSETHPAAPSLNCCYWLFSLAHEHTPSWKEHRNRLLPSLRGMGTMLAPDLTPVAWSRHLSARRREEQRGTSSSGGSRGF
jgi:hypothetical protein